MILLSFRTIISHRTKSEVHIEHNIEFFTVKTNSIFKGYTNLDRLKYKRQDCIDINRFWLNNLTVLISELQWYIAFVSSLSQQV